LAQSPVPAHLYSAHAVGHYDLDSQSATLAPKQRVRNDGPYWNLDFAAIDPDALRGYHHATVRQRPPGLALEKRTISILRKLDLIEFDEDLLGCPMQPTLRCASAGRVARMAEVRESDRTLPR